MRLDFWKYTISTVIVMSVICFAAPLSEAAKTVPTIRIEIPKKDDEKVEPKEQNQPTVPLDDSDLTPSIDKLDDAQFPDEKDEAEEPVERVPAVVFYGQDDLPEPVKALRKKLIDVAISGEIDKLKPLFEAFKEPPLLSFDDIEDPIGFLKLSSGDGEGREILAIMLEVLQSGYVLRDKGKDGEIFIWPYFVEIPPEELNPRQQVELFRIITAGDFEDMKDYGAYIFYRIGITPEGELKYFVAGD